MYYKEFDFNKLHVIRTLKKQGYNKGEYLAIKQAQDRGYLGRMVKTWCTADDERVCSLMKSMAEAGKVVSAICAAPMVLSKCGLLNGRKFTMYPGMEDFLVSGDVPGTAPAVVDGNIVTGKGPGAVFDFASAVAGVLGVDSCKCYSAMMWER